MTDQGEAPKTPTSAQPISSMVPGVAFETGRLPGPPLSPQAALEREDQRVFNTIAPADIETLRHVSQATLDIIPEKRWYSGEEISDEPSWKDVRVEVIAFPWPRSLIDGAEMVPLAHPWIFEEFPRINDHCLIARWLLRHPGRPGVLEVTWGGFLFDRTRIRRSVHFLGEGTPDDAARLMNLWVTDRPRIRPRRRRLEESQTSPWRYHAEAAIEMMRTEAGLTIRDAAARLNLPAYDDARPDRDGRAERSAERKLKRWIERLEKSDRSAP
jgi:hypothetical protein